MGSGSYSSRAWTDFKTTRSYDDPKTTINHIYKSRSIDSSLNPLRFSVRESVDGEDNPESTPIIIGLDVTGSMSNVLDVIARKGLKTVCEEVYNRKPVSDPHICVLGIGDVECDSSPFQATQFEADIRIFEQLEKLYLEGGGGGNNFESYILAWYFAKFRTKTDSFAKRGRKGFIFTVGDEEVTPSVSASQLTRFMGDKQTRDYTAEELLSVVYNEWNIYHIIVAEGHYASHRFNEVKESWGNILGDQRVSVLEDHTALGETIVSILELSAGRSIRDVTSSWDGSSAIAVASAIANIESSRSVSIDAAL